MEKSRIRDPGKTSLIRNTERYTEITHDPLLFSVVQGNIFTIHRETLTQYITFKRGGERGVCTLAPNTPWLEAPEATKITSNQNGDISGVEVGHGCP